MSEKVKAIPIADTGILAEAEDVERTALTGMFLIIENAMRKSRKYGTYAAFDAKILKAKIAPFHHVGGSDKSSSA